MAEDGKWHKRLVHRGLTIVVVIDCDSVVPIATERCNDADGRVDEKDDRQNYAMPANVGHFTWDYNNRETQRLWLRQG